MKTVSFYAGLYQDCFAYNLLAGSATEELKDPTFLDIGCYDPLFRNNTFLFEELGWKGLCFDLTDCERSFGFSSIRETPFIQMDTTSTNFSILLEDLKKEKEWLKGGQNDTLEVEFISLDVDEASLSTLDRLLEANVRFKCMCFEHDYLRIGEALRRPSRERLHSEGYEMLFPDISFPEPPMCSIMFDGNCFEDWWIDPSFFPDNIMSIKKEGLRYYDAVDRLKEFMGNEYVPNYPFSRNTFPDPGRFDPLTKKVTWNEPAFEYKAHNTK
tara:strand:- start:76218 stop:77027 length:810 start_codon:yes stop_codon:yes gene_type:complete